MLPNFKFVCFKSSTPSSLLELEARSWVRCWWTELLSATIISFTFSFKVIDTILTNFCCMLKFSIPSSLSEWRARSSVRCLWTWLRFATTLHFFLRLFPTSQSSLCYTERWAQIQMHTIHKFKNARCALHCRNTSQVLLGFICCSVKRNNKMRDILPKSLNIYLNTWIQWHTKIHTPRSCLQRCPVQTNVQGVSYERISIIFSKLYVKERCERNTPTNNYQKIIPGENMSSSAAFFWDTLFAIMIVVAIFGNTAVLWIVMRK